jgi:hypothetical protein
VVPVCVSDDESVSGPVVIVSEGSVGCVGLVDEGPVVMPLVTDVTADPVPSESLSVPSDTVSVSVSAGPGTSAAVKQPWAKNAQTQALTLESMNKLPDRV